MTGRRIRQMRGVLRLELRRCLFGLRAVPGYLLAALPVIAALMTVAVSSIWGPGELRSTAGTALAFAVLYEFTLRFLIFFGCVWISMNLFRAEVLDRSLHYYFLTPVRRELLVFGKYVAGWLVSTLLFSTGTCLSFFVLHAYQASGDLAALARGPAAGNLIAYLAMTALACLGYGAVFLFVGTFFRNPVIPALALFFWESLNFLLPALLKKISVIFYLDSLRPVPLPEGLFAVVAEPASPWLAAWGLMIFSVVMGIAAALRVRRMEIDYAAD